MEEVWKSVVGLEGCYEVSSSGRIRSLDRFIFDVNGMRKRRNGVYLTTSHDAKGYRYFKIKNNGVPKIFRIHRCVYEAFVGMIPENMEIDHIDRDTSNNSLSNLRIVTRRENSNNRKSTKEFIGVTFSKKNYIISIYYNGKAYYLGAEKLQSDAHEIYEKAKKAIENGSFENFYESRKFRKIKSLPKHIFYRRRNDTYTAIVKGEYIAESKDFEYVKSKLLKYLYPNE